MRKSIIALVIMATMGLVGCGNEAETTGASSNNSYESYIATSLKAATKMKFAVAGSDVTVPMYSALLMNPVDGTLKIPDGGDPSLSNPKVALGQVDGWSPNLPIVLEFEGAGLAAGLLNSSVYIITVDDNKMPTGALVAGTDFNVIADSSANSLTIVFTHSLQHGQGYMFAVTGFADKEGNTVGMSQFYAELKTANQHISQLAGPHALISGVETAVAAITSADARDIIYSSYFKTSSVGASLQAIKGAISQGITLGFDQVWQGDAVKAGVDISDLYSINITSSSEQTLADALDEDTEQFGYLFSSDAEKNTAIAALKTNWTTSGVANAVRVIKGTIKLPMFLETATDHDEWKKTPWQSATPSLAIISHYLTNGSAADKTAVAGQLVGLGIDPSKLTEPAQQAKLVGVTLTLANGQQLDPERFVTQYSPLPQIKSVQDVPFILFKQTGATDAADIPVTIYQHGVTTVKENAYLIAAQFSLGGAASGNPFALIAIDHPLHGDRALMRSNGDKIITTGATADVYMNLENLPVARDNMRQSAIDVVGVRTAIAQQGAAKLGVKADDVSFFGHSLGAITGIASYATANTVIPGVEQSKFALQAGAFANPGSGIPYLLLDSESFGPMIKHNMLMSNVDYQSYAASCAPNDPALCFTNFETNVLAQQPELKAKFDSGFQQFAYAAQTVLDTVDPLNQAKLIGPANPVYLMQAEHDTVVPNKGTSSVLSAQLAGTAPLIKVLGLNALTGSVATGDTEPKKFIANFAMDGLTGGSNWVTHGSVLVPTAAIGNKDAAATAEVQAQIISFILTKGQGVTVKDTSLIKPLPAE
jgi:Pla-1/cef family extracellular lipase